MFARDTTNKILTYSARDIHIRVKTEGLDEALYEVTGLAEDSFLSIAPVGQGVMPHYGVDGWVVRAIDPNRLYTITFVTLQQSPADIDFMNFYLADRDNQIYGFNHSNTKTIAEANEQQGFYIEIEDARSKIFYRSNHAWVTNMSERGYGRDAGNRQYQIMCADLEFTSTQTADTEEETSTTT